jgi:hypothetical protein
MILPIFSFCHAPLAPLSSMNRKFQGSWFSGLNEFELSGIILSERMIQCRSQWPRCLRHELSSPAQTLGSWFPIPLEIWMSMCVYSVFVLFCVQVAALWRADLPSKDSCRLYKKNETEEEARAQQRAVEPLMTEWICFNEPMTLAARSKAWTVFSPWNTGIAGSNPTWSMDVCVRLFYVCAVLCADSGLTAG